MRVPLSLALILLLGTTARANTVLWDRSVNPAVQDYVLYGCFTAGCTPTATVVVVPQAATGTTLSVPLDLAGKAGALAVTARDALRESPKSAPVPFAFPVATPITHITSKNLNTDQVEVTGLSCTSLKTTGRGLKRVITCVP